MYGDNEVIYQNSTVCSSDNTGGWVPVWFDVSEAAGQTVTVLFEILSVYGDALASIVYIDDVSISNTHP